MVAPPGTEVEVEPEPTGRVDLLSYGRPLPLSFDPGQPDRRFTYEIGRRIASLDGRPGLWWTINSRLFPDVPMFHVEEGDVVRMTIRNCHHLDHAAEGLVVHVAYDGATASYEVFGPADNQPE